MKEDRSAGALNTLQNGIIPVSEQIIALKEETSAIGERNEELALSFRMVSAHNQQLGQTLNDLNYQISEYENRLKFRMKQQKIIENETLEYQKKADKIKNSLLKDPKFYEVAKKLRTLKKSKEKAQHNLQKIKTILGDPNHDMLSGAMQLVEMRVHDLYYKNAELQQQIYLLQRLLGGNYNSSDLESEIKKMEEINRMKMEWINMRLSLNHRKKSNESNGTDEPADFDMIKGESVDLGLSMNQNMDETDQQNSGNSSEEMISDQNRMDTNEEDSHNENENPETSLLVNKTSINDENRHEILNNDNSQLDNPFEEDKNTNNNKSSIDAIESLLNLVSNGANGEIAIETVADVSGENIIDSNIQNSSVLDNDDLKNESNSVDQGEKLVNENNSTSENGKDVFHNESSGSSLGSQNNDDKNGIQNNSTNEDAPENPDIQNNDVKDGLQNNSTNESSSENPENQSNDDKNGIQSNSTNDGIPENPENQSNDDKNDIQSNSTNDGIPVNPENQSNDDKNDIQSNSTNESVSENPENLSNDDKNGIQSNSTNEGIPENPENPSNDDKDGIQSNSTNEGIPENPENQSNNDKDGFLNNSTNEGIPENPEIQSNDDKDGIQNNSTNESVSENPENQNNDDKNGIHNNSTNEDAPENPDIQNNDVKDGLQNITTNESVSENPEIQNNDDKNGIQSSAASEGVSENPEIQNNDDKDGVQNNSTNESSYENPENQNNDDKNGIQSNSTNDGIPENPEIQSNDDKDGFLNNSTNEGIPENPEIQSNNDKDGFLNNSTNESSSENPENQSNDDKNDIQSNSTNDGIPVNPENLSNDDKNDIQSNSTNESVSENPENLSNDDKNGIQSNSTNEGIPENPENPSNDDKDGIQSNSTNEGIPENPENQSNNDKDGFLNNSTNEGIPENPEIQSNDDKDGIQNNSTNESVSENPENQNNDDKNGIHNNSTNEDAPENPDIQNNDVKDGLQNITTNESVSENPEIQSNDSQNDMQNQTNEVESQGIDIANEKTTNKERKGGIIPNIHNSEVSIGNENQPKNSCDVFHDTDEHNNYTDIDINHSLETEQKMILSEGGNTLLQNLIGSDDGKPEANDNCSTSGETNNNDKRNPDITNERESIHNNAASSDSERLPEMNHSNSAIGIIDGKNGVFNDTEMKQMSTLVDNDKNNESCDPELNTSTIVIQNGDSEVIRTETSDTPTNALGVDLAKESENMNGEKLNGDSNDGTQFYESNCNDNSETSISKQSSLIDNGSIQPGFLELNVLHLVSEENSNQLGSSNSINVNNDLPKNTDIHLVSDFSETNIIETLTNRNGDNAGVVSESDFGTNDSSLPIDEIKKNNQETKSESIDTNPKNADNRQLSGNNDGFNDPNENHYNTDIVSNTTKSYDQNGLKTDVSDQNYGIDRENQPNMKDSNSQNQENSDSIPNKSHDCISTTTNSNVTPFDSSIINDFSSNAQDSENQGLVQSSDNATQTNRDLVSNTISSVSLLTQFNNYSQSPIPISTKEGDVQIDEEQFDIEKIVETLLSDNLSTDHTTMDSRNIQTPLNIESVVIPSPPRIMEIDNGPGPRRKRNHIKPSFNPDDPSISDLKYIQTLVSISSKDTLFRKLFSSNVVHDDMKPKHRKYNIITIKEDDSLINDSNDYVYSDGCGSEYEEEELSITNSNQKSKNSVRIFTKDVIVPLPDYDFDYDYEYFSDDDTNINAKDDDQSEFSSFGSPQKSKPNQKLGTSDPVHTVSNPDINNDIIDFTELENAADPSRKNPLAELIPMLRKEAGGDNEDYLKTKHEELMKSIREKTKESSRLKGQINALQTPKPKRSPKPKLKTSNTSLSISSNESRNPRINDNSSKKSNFVESDISGLTLEQDERLIQSQNTQIELIKKQQSEVDQIQNEVKIVDNQIREITQEKEKKSERVAMLRAELDSLADVISKFEENNLREIRLTQDKQRELSEITSQTGIKRAEYQKLMGEITIRQNHIKDMTEYLGRIEKQLADLSARVRPEIRTLLDDVKNAKMQLEQTQNHALDRTKQIEEKKKYLSTIQDSVELVQIRELRVNKFNLEQELYRHQFLKNSKEPIREIVEFSSSNSMKRSSQLSLLNEGEGELIKLNEERIILENYQKLLEDQISKHKQN